MNPTNLAYGIQCLSKMPNSLDTSIKPGVIKCDEIIAGNQIISRAQILTSAELLDLHNTPIVVIPAPGENIISIPLYIMYAYKIGSVDYGVTNHPQFDLEYSNTAESIVGQPVLCHEFISGNTITQTENNVIGVTPNFVDVLNNASPFMFYDMADNAQSLVNKSVHIKISDGALTNGNGVLYIYSRYFNLILD